MTEMVTQSKGATVASIRVSFGQIPVLTAVFVDALRSKLLISRDLHALGRKGNNNKEVFKSHRCWYTDNYE